MGVAGGPNLVEDRLILALDASDRNSYVSGSTTWFDLSGNNRSGSLTNGPTFSSGSGGSIVFDGVDDFVNCGSGSLFNLTNYTFSAWTYPTRTTGLQNIIAYEYCVKYRLNFQNIQVLLGNGTAWENIFITSGNSVNSNTWYNITLTVSAGVSCNIYVNGISQLSQAVSSIGGTNSRQLFIGAYDSSGSPAELFKGNIASSQIYSKALSADEVLQNYNATKTRFGL